jgi:hypothetical protein
MHAGRAEERCIMMVLVVTHSPLARNVRDLQAKTRIDL